MRIGWGEIVFVLFLILLFFGTKRLPELARAIGRSLQEFKKGTREIVEDLEKTDEGKPNSDKTDHKDES
jgi:sec-independent protein translocase protein TatA